MTIDDLFSFDPDSVRLPERRPRLVRLFSLLAISAVLAALAFVWLRVVELETSIPVLFAAAVAVMIVWRLGKAVKPPLASRQAGRRHEERASVPDGVKVAVDRWDKMMDWSRTDAARFNRRVLPRIAEVVDERLRQGYGVTRDNDPERAHAILGDPLWTFVTTPSRRPPQPRELDEIITALEKL